MAITSLPSVSNTQLNQNEILQAGGGFQAATVSNSNTAAQFVDAPIFARGKEDVVSAPSVTNTQANLTHLEQVGGGHEPGFQFASVENDNTALQNIFSPISRYYFV